MEFGVRLLILSMVWFASEVSSNTTTNITSTTINIDAEYFEQVVLNCSLDNTVLHSAHLWILPSGEVIKPTNERKDNHVSLNNDGFTLTIDKCDDPDFGYYYCIAKDTNGELVVVRRGLNIDGPYYGPDHYKKFEKSAIIGGIAAGAMLLVVSITWAICAKCCSSPKLSGPNIEIGEKETVTMREKADPNTSMTSIEDSIYYIADGVHVKKADSLKHTATNGITVTHHERVVSSDSGHYQSIGSLERDHRLLSEVVFNGQLAMTNPEFDTRLKLLTPTDIYRSNLLSIHQGELFNYDHFDFKEDSDSVFVNSGRQSTVSGRPSLTSDLANNDTDTTVVDDPIYAQPSPRSRKQKETVTVVDGEVILERTGTSVVVTTSSITPPTTTGYRDSMADIDETQPGVHIITGLTTKASEHNIEGGLTFQSETVKETSEKEGIEIPFGENKTVIGDNVTGEVTLVHYEAVTEDQTTTTDVEIKAASIKTNDIQSELTRELSEKLKKPKDSSSSIPDIIQRSQDRSKSNSDSGGSSPRSLDQSTILNYQSVLASLVSKRSKEDVATSDGTDGNTQRSSKGYSDDTERIADVRL